MHPLERFCTTLRHSPGLRNAQWLWDQLRAPYTALVATLAQNGVERVINGTDVIRLTPEYRAITENYEPDVWKHVMDEARIGDVAVDVGANVGLYAIARSGWETVARYTRSSPIQRIFGLWIDTAVSIRSLRESFLIRSPSPGQMVVLRSRRGVVPSRTLVAAHWCPKWTLFGWIPFLPETALTF
jgi:hypothetical protein